MPPLSTQSAVQKEHIKKNKAFIMKRHSGSIHFSEVRSSNLSGGLQRGDGSAAAAWIGADKLA